MLKHGSGKDDALSAALHGAIITGQTDRARTLVAHGAPVDDEHLDNAKNRALTDIVAILKDATDTRREQKFTAAVAAEDDSGNNVLIKPQGRTWRLDTNDCTIYGHKDDLREFIQAQRDIFSLTDRFNTWSGKSPLPEDTVASVWKKIEDAEKKLCDKLAVYHDGTIVENHLPFVRAAFDRETQKTTYLYLIPGSAGGAVQEQARYYRVGLQEGADEELALDRAIQRLPARTP